MAKRYLLRRQLFTSWKETIENQYRCQQINSERGLQLFFCSALMSKFEEKELKRRLFIEPRLRTHNGIKGPMPDVVICSSNQIIGIVELKYTPKGKPKISKDLATLSWAYSEQSGILLANNRFLGVPYDETQYTLASDVVLCWAGVHRGIRDVSYPLNQQVAAPLKPNFMELHALTSANQEPRIASNYRPRK